MTDNAAFLGMASSFTRYDHTHNAPQEQETERLTCPYCGCSNHPDWLTCGEGQTWGCGAALTETAETMVVGCPTFTEAGEAIRAVVGVTHPGISSAEFERQFRLTPEYRDSFAGQYEQLRREVENLKQELGRAFRSLFRPLLKLFFLKEGVG